MHKTDIPGHILWRARRKVRIIAPWLTHQAAILDIGSGNGGLVWLLQQSKFQVTPSDIRNKSRIPGIDPVLLNGDTLPFADGAFHTVMLITVLHHTPHPEQLLREAARVASNRLIIMEDVYNNELQKWATYLTDSLVNNEWRHHPHTNKTHQQWLDLFNQYGLDMIHQQRLQALGFVEQRLYVTQKKGLM